MSRLEKTRILQQKAQDLISWFYEKPPPAAPFEIKQAETVMDLSTFLYVHIMRLHAHYPDPFSRLFVNSYYSLLDLKKYMDEKQAH